ncbi:unnamed protein product [Mycena citricolor]|uniref:Secreted protein n=1 Tax=Mycena citricolor TaxID=2018698 RepID=A0AAD2K4A9_9AGAR|nr:unnamed protein product [Mycena citricolor]CAK5276594.1 unnamed protein product [Mycena citricolor]
MISARACLGLFLVSLVAAVDTHQRKCALCPNKLHDKTTGQNYIFELREIQPVYVVCGYAEQRMSKMMGRNGWPYCTYNDDGKLNGTDINCCPAQLPLSSITENCTESMEI